MHLITPVSFTNSMAAPPCMITCTFCGWYCSFISFPSIICLVSSKDILPDNPRASTILWIQQALFLKFYRNMLLSGNSSSLLENLGRFSILLSQSRWDLQVVIATLCYIYVSTMIKIIKKTNSFTATQTQILYIQQLQFVLLPCGLHEGSSNWLSHMSKVTCFFNFYNQCNIIIVLKVSDASICN